MGPGGVFPAEMPERGRSLVDPLDDDTADRLVAGRVGPDDAPPGYAGVAAILQAAAAPAAPEELTGREAALAIFRTHGPSPRAQRPAPTRTRGQAHRRARGRPQGRTRGRLVALALAGAVAAGGLWTAAGAPSPAGLPSRAGAPQSGGAGSGAPGFVTQARPTTPPVTAAGANPRAPAQPSATGPSARNGGGGVGASGASHHGAKRHRPGRPPKPKPERPEPEKPGKPEAKPKPEHQK